MMQHVCGATRLADLVALLAAGAGNVSAHAKYVTPRSNPVEVAAFLSAALTDSFNLAVLGTGGVGIAVAGAAYLRFQSPPNDVRVFRRTVASCESLLPRLLRLAVGLPLIGAGFPDYFFSPAVQSSSPIFVQLLGITVGFLLLFGFGMRLVAAVGLGAYLVGLAVEPALVLTFEYVPSFLTIAFVGSSHPSADHVVASMAADGRTFYSRIGPFYRRVALSFIKRIHHLEAYVPAVLRVGLGLTLVCLGIAQKLMEPGDALTVVARYDLTAVVPVAPELWVIDAGLTEALVGVLLVGGAFIRTVSGVAFLLFTATLFDLPDDPVLAHISLFDLMLAPLVTGGGPLSVDCTLSNRGTNDAKNDGDVSGRSAGA